MKKIIALLLVLVLVLGAFAGCSPADKNDSGSTDSTGSTGEGTGNEGGTETVEIPTYRMGILLEDPIKLITLFRDPEFEDGTPEVKNFALDLMADLEGGKAAMTMGANMFGKDYGLNIYGNEQNVVISTPGLYDKSYGMTMEELMTLYTELMEQDSSSMGDA